MLECNPTVILAQTDVGELIPFLIFAFVIITRLTKLLAGKKRDGANDLPLDEPSGGMADNNDPGAQIRRFLEDLRRQANGETSPPPPAVPPPIPPPAARPTAWSAPASNPAIPPPRPTVAAARRPEATAIRRPVVARTKPSRPQPVMAAVTRTVAVPLPAPVKLVSSPEISTRILRPTSPWVAALRRDSQGLREAVFLRAVLGPPVALRHPHSQENKF